MANPVHFSDDPQQQRTAWNRYLDEIDAEIREEREAKKKADSVQGEPHSPFVVDAGPYTTRRDNEAIQAEQDRWTRLEKLGR